MNEHIAEPFRSILNGLMPPSVVDAPKRYRIVRTLVYEGDLGWLIRTMANSRTRVQWLDRELGREGRCIYEISIIGPEAIVGEVGSRAHKA